MYIDDGDGSFDINKDTPAKGERNKKQSTTIDLVVGGPSANALVVQDQTLVEGNTKSITIQSIELMDTPGILFIAKDKNGKPGAILAQKSYGKNTRKTNLEVTLKEAITEAQTLHATLYEGPSWKPSSPILKGKDGKPLQLTFQVKLQSATQGAEIDIEDQTLTQNFDTIHIKRVALPGTYLKNGHLHIFQHQNGTFSKKVAEFKLNPKKTYTDLAIKLDHLIVGSESFQVKMLNEKGTSFTDAGGAIIQTIFNVTGDLKNGSLHVEDQQINKDLQTILISSFSFPPRFAQGGFVAIYEDDKGSKGKLLYKKQFKAGEHKDISLRLPRRSKKQRLHAVLHSGRSWVSSKPPPAIAYTSGGVIESSFEIDNIAFHAKLDVADQVLTDNKTLVIQQVTIPSYVFGANLGIYSDNNGKPDQLLVQRKFPRGTRTNTKLTIPLQQGKKTLHALLYSGQTWDPQNAPLLKDESGKELHLTFKIGAASLNYLVIKPYTTTHPRHAVLEKAYSYKKMAWVVLARDNNGQPGTIIAKKRIAARNTGRVVFSRFYNNFETSGGTVEYLQSRPGTYRRYIRGEENLHVLMYADDPQDNKFTYKPGSTDDQPILDAHGKHVTGRWKVTVKSSIQNVQKDSNRYYGPCSVSQWRRNPTTLRADCRCSTVLVSRKFPDCSPIIADSLKLSYGKGPRVADLNFGMFISGFGEPSSNEIISVVKWKDHKTKRPENGVYIDAGVVMAIHAETGDRRLIGGRHYNSQKGAYDIGTGPVLSYPFRILKGPDSQYYIASYGYVKGDKNTTGAGLIPTVDIIRMDPKTGNRDYVWRSNHLGYNLTQKPNPYGHCGTGKNAKYGYRSVQVRRQAFAMDPQGNFYLSYANNGKNSTSEGVGIIKISADGKKCDFVTRTDTGKDNVLYKGKNIGKGPKPQAGPYKGMLYKDGYLYASIFVGSETYKINVATGDREIILKKGHQNTGGISDGTVIKWDAHRKLIWQQGISILTSYYNPATQTSHSLHCGSSDRNYKGINCMLFRGTFILGNPLGRGFWFHPTDKDYMFMQMVGAIVKVHLPSGTDIIHSY